MSTDILHKYTDGTNIHPLSTEYYEIKIFELRCEAQTLMSLITAVVNKMHEKFRP